MQLQCQVRPAGAFRLPGRVGRDGLLRRRDASLDRLLHHAGEPVVVRVAQPGPDRVLFAASASSRQAAEHGIARMRFALGVDDDLGEFRRRFARDRLIGASVRRRPWLRVMRRPDPFEALAFAICEQLIDYERAAAIQRRVVARLGRRCTASGLRDLPALPALAGVAPALLESMDLATPRALALVRAAREVMEGRIELDACDPEPGWRRLRTIRGIGPWTVECLALYGQGRYDQLPAGDLELLRLAGRVLSGGDPYARASEPQVRALFAPYEEWAGLAAMHALSGPMAVTAPGRAETRW